MPICANHYANHKKVQKTMPTVVLSTFNKWQNSAEKSQAHILKVVGSNPTHATNLFNKINDLNTSKSSVFGAFCCNFLVFVPTIIPTGRQVFSNLIITIRIFNYSFICTL